MCVTNKFSHSEPQKLRQVVRMYVNKTLIEIRGWSGVRLRVHLMHPCALISGESAGVRARAPAPLSRAPHVAHRINCFVAQRQQFLRSSRAARPGECMRRDRIITSLSDPKQTRKPPPKSRPRLTFHVPFAPTGIRRVGPMVLRVAFSEL